MKKAVFYLLTGLLAVFVVLTRPALAQSETPPIGSTGTVTGTIIIQNTGSAVTEELDVMLHILDQDYAEAGMLHGQSQMDGTFLFTDVPFDANSQYAVMASYDGVTYFSNIAPADMNSLQTIIEVPVYESTSDLANVQVDQMHVLFSFSEDGLEIKEIYILSNAGERTVKDAYRLEGDKLAALKFPLPLDADYVFFKPDDPDRFIKFSGGFADTYPILPGTGSSQIMVSYLVPYSGERTYIYKAPLNIARMNFLVPDDANLSLKGRGLEGSESMSLQNGESYLVYSHSDLRSEQTVSVSIGGKIAGKSTDQNPNTSFAVGAAFLGLAMIGAGMWWWRRPGDADEEENDRPNAEMTFDHAINEIARLDQAHEMGDIDEQEYQQSRESLRKRAKALMAQKDKE